MSDIPLLNYEALYSEMLARREYFSRSEISKFTRLLIYRASQNPLWWKPKREVKDAES